MTKAMMYSFGRLLESTTPLQNLLHTTTDGSSVQLSLTYPETNLTRLARGKILVVCPREIIGYQTYVRENV